MDGTIRTLEEIPAAMRVGRVEARGVRVGERLLDASRAASCLVAPTAGDTVLVAEASGRAWVLAVLSRADQDAVATRIEADGDLEIVAPRGRVTVAARDGIEAVTAAAAKLSARELSVQARVASLMVDAAEIVGGAVNAAVDRWALQAGTATTVAERLVQRARLAVREVAELDQVRAGVLRITGKDAVQVHGKLVALTADDLAKVDAAQIHMG